MYSKRDRNYMIVYEAKTSHPNPVFAKPGGWLIRSSGSVNNRSATDEVWIGNPVFSAL